MVGSGSADEVRLEMEETELMLLERMVAGSAKCRGMDDGWYWSPGGYAVVYLLWRRVRWQGWSG